MHTRKTLPHFETEQEERTFWEQHDSSHYVDFNQAYHAVLPNLKPSSQTLLSTTQGSHKETQNGA